MKKTISSLLTSAAVLVSSIAPVYAQQINLAPDNIGKLPSLTIPDLISGLIRLLVIAAAVIFFFWLILGGINWILSGGDKTKTEAARNQITAALVGLVIVFSAWAIAQLISTLFGIDLFQLEFRAITK